MKKKTHKDNIITKEIYVYKTLNLEYIEKRDKNQTDDIYLKLTKQKQHIFSCRFNDNYII